MLNHKKNLLMLAAALCLSSLSTPLVLAEQSIGEAWLKVSPGRCVALRQGQSCHQTLTFRWGLPKDGDYCLQRSDAASPEVCWSNTELSSYKLRFVGDSSTQFQLLESPGNRVVGHVVVEVAWVYKSSRSRTGWRMF